MRSYGSISKNEIHRRRQCGDCKGRFPTAERVDFPALWRQHPELRDAARPTLDDLEKAVRRVQDQALLHEYSVRDWSAVEKLFLALHEDAPATLRPR